MKKILIVQADYYKDVSLSLLKSAKNSLNNYSIKIIKVPGVFEIPVTISKNINKHDAFIALGCVIKGETYHFEIVANESARALTDLSLNYSIPIGNGILTVSNLDQAIKRSDPLRSDKGAGAALACLSLINIKNKIKYG